MLDAGDFATTIVCLCALLLSGVIRQRDAGVASPASMAAAGLRRATRALMS